MIKVFLLIGVLAFNAFAMEDHEQTVVTATPLGAHDELVVADVIVPGAHGELVVADAISADSSDYITSISVDAAPYDINVRIAHLIKGLDERDQDLKKLLTTTADINDKRFKQGFSQESSIEFIHLLLEQTNLEAKIWNMFGTAWQDLLTEQIEYLNSKLEELRRIASREDIEGFDYVGVINKVFDESRKRNEHKFDLNDRRTDEIEGLIPNLLLQLSHFKMKVNQMGIDEVNGFTDNRTKRLADKKNAEKGKAKVLLQIAELNLESAYLQECMFFLNANLAQQDGVCLFNAEFMAELTANRSTIEQSGKNVEKARLELRKIK